jgi:subtilisin family serine protease
MKKIYCLVCVLLFSVLANAQSVSHSSVGMSPLTRKYLQLQNAPASQDNLPEGYVYKKHADGQIYISALAKIKDAKTAEEGLKNIGAFIGTKAGNIWTLQLPPANVNQLVKLPGFAYIQLDEPVFPTLDVARQKTHVDSVQAGIGLPMRYSGKGVIVGVIDFGFDYNHPTFYDTTHTQYRIKRVWELNGVGTPPTGYSYGNEINDTTLIKAQGTDNDVQTHGTAVCGLAGGSGYGSSVSNARFRGMAYDCDFVLVGVRRDTIATQWLQGSFNDFIDGIAYIFNYANTVAKPCVVNISWGSQSGPHDGTTLFNQACANMSGPGRIVVMSAGNEGTERIHLAKTFTPSDTLMKTFVTFNNAVYNRTWVDAWGDTSKTFCAQVELFRNGNFISSTGFQCIDDTSHDTYLLDSAGVDTCFVQFISKAVEFNSKPRMTIDLYNKSTDSVVVSFKSNDVSIYVWNEYYYFGYKYAYSSAFDSINKPWATRGNSISTVSDMGASDSVLLVGAYASKVAFTDINGNGWTYQGYVPASRLVPFSSRGPMADGRIKPDFTAPGLTIATAISSYDTAYTQTGSNSSLTISEYTDPVLTRNFYYAEFIGTSASSPISAGIVALMLQVYPNLSASQAKSIIRTTCLNDAFTGVIPMAGNNNWGRGKINAYGAVKMLLQQTGLYHYSGEEMDCILYPNPSDGHCLIEFNAQHNSSLSIEVFDITGNKIISMPWNVVSGVNQHALELTNFPAGSYLVRVSSEKGFVSMKTIRN